MSIVSADGQEVQPVEEDRFLIGVAETYDVLVKVPGSGSYEFRASSHDGSGYASVWIGNGEKHPARVVPGPNLYHNMGGLSLKKVFALTPAGSMGMGDGMVKMGMFDKPGMAMIDTIPDPAMSEDCYHRATTTSGRLICRPDHSNSRCCRLHGIAHHAESRPGHQFRL